ncbi:adenylate kinase [Mycoplasma ovis str. Michigan]|uniref:Adenylate kinase n=1 Tax=Mycoplasma ovis str. Michigan TaxID=1415773 RepID=A0ABM5P0K9_9MOLU|nr:nucleoside monophosphate kinase [Mycoplasma ovis]AHC39963.1 adenylate kinase [Mycoplasma ovis str. Michigan]
MSKKVVLIIFLAPPGSGKGTLSELLNERDNVHILCAGKLLRALFAKKAEQGKETESLEGVHKGKYLSDEIVNNCVTEELDRIFKESKEEKFFISLDGYPRTIGQAERLIEWAKDHELLIVKMEGLSADEIWARLSKRYLCQAEEHVFNASFGLPENLICPKDGSKLIRREDDASIELVKKRLLQHDSLTSPVWEYFQSKGHKTFVIDSRLKIEDLYKSFKEKICF